MFLLTTLKNLTDPYIANLFAAWGAHDGSSGMAAAVLKYGKAANRVSGFTDKDKVYAVQHLKKNLMAVFNYTYPR